MNTSILLPLLSLIGCTSGEDDEATTTQPPATADPTASAGAQSTIATTNSYKSFYTLNRTATKWALDHER